MSVIQAHVIPKVHTCCCWVSGASRTGIWSSVYIGNGFDFVRVLWEERKSKVFLETKDWRGIEAIEEWAISAKALGAMCFPFPYPRVSLGRHWLGSWQGESAAAGVKAVKGTLPTCSTSSGTKCELQVVSGAMFALEYPLLISVVSQTCFEMPLLPLLQCESPMTDCQSLRECCKVHPWAEGW